MLELWAANNMNRVQVQGEHLRFKWNSKVWTLLHKSNLFRQSHAGDQRGMARLVQDDGRVKEELSSNNLDFPMRRVSRWAWAAEDRQQLVASAVGWGMKIAARPPAAEEVWCCWAVVVSSVESSFGLVSSRWFYLCWKGLIKVFFFFSETHFKGKPLKKKETWVQTSQARWRW